MSWELLLALIVKEGFEVALRLFEMSSTSGKPTPEQLVELRALAANSSSSLLEDAIRRSGRELNSPEAKALLALTGKTT